MKANVVFKQSLSIYIKIKNATILLTLKKGE